MFWITIITNGLKEQNSTYVVDQLVDDAEIIQHFDPHVIFNLYFYSILIIRNIYSNQVQRFVQPHLVIFNDYDPDEELI